MQHRSHLFQGFGRAALWCHSVTQMLACHHFFDVFRLLHLLDSERHCLVAWLSENALLEYTCKRLRRDHIIQTQ